MCIFVSNLMQRTAQFEHSRWRWRQVLAREIGVCIVVEKFKLFLIGDVFHGKKRSRNFFFFKVTCVWGLYVQFIMTLKFDIWFVSIPYLRRSLRTRLRIFCWFQMLAIQITISFTVQSQSSQTIHIKCLLTYHFNFFSGCSLKKEC